jgi:MFS transporter, DHA2 family, multidrug resistance protein
LSSIAATTPQTGFAHALVLLSVILATTLYATTLTIANVALPQMQGDLSASIDQIAWVLTFNIVATAIATPPRGWLAARPGLMTQLAFGTLPLILLATRTRVPRQCRTRAKRRAKSPNG